MLVKVKFDGRALLKKLVWSIPLFQNLKPLDERYAMHSWVYFQEFFHSFFFFLSLTFSPPFIPFISFFVCLYQNKDKYEYKGNVWEDFWWVATRSRNRGDRFCCEFMFALLPVSGTQRVLSGTRSRRRSLRRLRRGGEGGIWIGKGLWFPNIRINSNLKIFKKEKIQILWFLNIRTRSS